MSYVMQPTRTCYLSCWMVFWNTQYNTPYTFCLAGYSVVLQVSGHPFDSRTDALPYRANGQTHIYLLVFSARCLGMPWAEAPTSLDLTDRL